MLEMALFRVQMQVCVCWVVDVRCVLGVQMSEMALFSGADACAVCVVGVDA